MQFDNFLGRVCDRTGLGRRDADKIVQADPVHPGVATGAPGRWRVS